MAWATKVVNEGGNPYTQRWETVLHNTLAPFAEAGDVGAPGGKKARKVLRASTLRLLTKAGAERLRQAGGAYSARLKALKAEKRLKGFKARCVAPPEHPTPRVC